MVRGYVDGMTRRSGPSIGADLEGALPAERSQPPSPRHGQPGPPAPAPAAAAQSSLATWRYLLQTRPEMRAVSLVYLVQGLGRFSNLAVFVFLKDGAGLEPPVVAAVTSVTKLPWVIKPLYGFLSDAVPLWGYRRKSYLLLCGLASATALLCLSTAPYTAYSVLLFLTPSAAAVAFSDVVADSLVVEAARELDGRGGGGGAGRGEKGMRKVDEGAQDEDLAPLLQPASLGRPDAFDRSVPTASEIRPHTVSSRSSLPGTCSPRSASRSSSPPTSARPPSSSTPPPVTGASLQSLCWAWQSSGQILACSAGGRFVKRLGPRAVIALSALAPLLVSVAALSVRERRQPGSSCRAEKGASPLRAVARLFGSRSKRDKSRSIRGEHELAALPERGDEAKGAAMSGRDPGGVALRASEVDSPSRAAQLSLELATPAHLRPPPVDHPFSPSRTSSSRQFAPPRPPSLLSLLVAQARALASALSRPSLLLPTLFGFLWQASPNVSTTMQYFESEALGFDPGMLGDLQLVGAIACLVGVWTFDSFLASRPLKQVFVVTGIGAAVAACSQLVLIQRWNLAIGIPDRLFALADAAVVEAAGQVAFLPALVLAARSCPEGVEATLFAAVMSVSNLGMGLGDALGAALAKALGVSRHAFGNMGALVLVAAALQLVPIAFLPWLPNEVCEEQTKEEPKRSCGAEGAP